MRKEKLRRESNSDLKDRKLCYIACLLLIGSLAIGEAVNHFLGRLSVISLVFAIGALFALIACITPKFSQIGGICILVLALVIGTELMVFLIGEYPAKNSSDVAAWVQALGTIAAISAAIWVSRTERQHKDTQDEAKEAELQNRVRYEVANLAYDVLGFTDRIIDTKKPTPPMYRVNEPEFEQLLERMTWVTRFATNGDCLEAIRNLRELHLETTLHLRHLSYVDDSKKLQNVKTNQLIIWGISNQWRNVRGMYSHGKQNYDL